jgi:ferric-dicitrate binding protein FerR (iron transport regulator)
MIVEKKYRDDSMKARNLSLAELLERLESVRKRNLDAIAGESATRLAHVSAALSCLEDSLFYVRMYRSTDNTGEGERRRQQLIGDSEMIINLIRNGGLYP